MLSTFDDIRRLVSVQDRRQWPLLLAASLVAGLARSLFLALLNETIADIADSGVDAWTLVGSLALMGLALGGGYFAAVRGQLVASRVAIGMRDRLLDEIGAANLHLLERVGIAGLHHHLVHSINVVSNSYATFLSFGTALVTLVFNFVYIGWLSPVGLALGVTITVTGVLVHLFFERRNLVHRRKLELLTRQMNVGHRAFLDGYKELRLSRAKNDDFRERLDAVNSERFAEGVAEARISAAGRMITTGFQFLLMLSIVFVLPLVSTVEPVLLLQLLTAILFTVSPLDAAVDAFPGFMRARVALDNLKRIREEIGDIHEPASDPVAGTLPRMQSLELRGAAFRFPGEEGFNLGPIDLTLQAGEVVFVVGGNGAGKTLLLRVLTGLYRPSEGAILVNGRRVEDGERQAYREQFAAIYGDFYLFEQLLGRDAVDAERVNVLLADVGLARKTRYVDGRFTSLALSTGQRKRLAYVVSLVDDRQVYVLDEFAAEQDPEHRRLFYEEWLPALKQAGKTVLIVSHDDEYFYLADKVVKLDFGRVVSVHAVDHTSDLI